MDKLMRAALAGRPLPCRPFIDVHGHVGGGTIFPLYDPSPESLLATMDRLGIERLAVSSYAGLNGYARQGNDELIRLVARWPERFLGYASIDPTASRRRIVAELERARRHGLVALKIHTMARVPYDAEAYDTALAWANAHDWPVLAHTWGGEVAILTPAFERYPRVRFMLAHAGCTQREVYARAGRDYPHVWLETCHSHCLIGMMEYLVREVGAHKVVWGSDMSFMGAEHQVGRVVFAKLAPAQKAAILGKNASAIFGLSAS